MFLREITYFFGTKLLVPRNDNREVKFDVYGKTKIFALCLPLSVQQNQNIHIWSE